MISTMHGWAINVAVPSPEQADKPMEYIFIMVGDELPTQPAITEALMSQGKALLQLNSVQRSVPLVVTSPDEETP